MKQILALFAVLFTLSGFSQNVNDYKYVVVANKFEFQKEPNQYNLNNLVRMMFEKYGFEVYFENSQKPDDLALNRCKALYAEVVKPKALLSTNIIIALTDCTGKTLFTSETGKSKEKDFKKAYYEAIRRASVSLNQLNYNYSGADNNTLVTANNTTATPADTVTTDTAVKVETLFAQPITNGFQLVDSKPQVVLRIYKTSKPDSFTAISDSNNGLVFKKGDDWYYEYYQDDKLVSKKLDIKF